MTTPQDRLYIVVRADLSPGLQAAQAVHAAFLFADRFPDMTRNWLHDSNFLVIVSVPDEESLLNVGEAAFFRNIPRAFFREPDLDNETTAIALAPGPAAKKLCANLPRALRESAMT